MHSLSTALHIHVGNIGNLDLFGVFVLTPNHTGRLFTALPKSMIIHKVDFNATDHIIDQTRIMGYARRSRMRRVDLQGLNDCRDNVPKYLAHVQFN